MPSQFRLEFACITLETMAGTKIRGLVLAVSEVPGQPNFVHAGIALETGVILQKIIPRLDLRTGQQNSVTLIEARNERGLPGTRQVLDVQGF